jgi:hypothetical protein
MVPSWQMTERSAKWALALAKFKTVNLASFKKLKPDSASNNDLEVGFHHSTQPIEQSLFQS